MLLSPNIGAETTSKGLKEELNKFSIFVRVVLSVERMGRVSLAFAIELLTVVIAGVGWGYKRGIKSVQKSLKLYHKL